MKITAVMWGSDMPLLIEASKELGIELSAWSTHDVEDDAKREDCIKSFEHADVILLHPSNEEFWDELIERLNKDVPTISFGHDSSFWQLSNVPLEVVATVNVYHLYGGWKTRRTCCAISGKRF